MCRMAVLAGLSVCPRVTVNRLCASGLTAVNTTARLISSGEAETVIAGGVESMSRSLVTGKPLGGKPIGNQTLYDTSLGWRFPNPKMEEIFLWKPWGIRPKIGRRLRNIPRGTRPIALSSHQKAFDAWEAGH